MIFKHHCLKLHPSIFMKLTGLRVEEFESLTADILPQFEHAKRQRLSRSTRQRAEGAGLTTTLNGRDQLLLTVIWLRQYPTHEVLGYLFGVSQPTTGRYLQRMLPLLEQAGRDTMRMSDPGRKRRRSLADLLENIPELAVVVDSFEQRVQRPKRAAERDGWYSGKKRMHTVKSQVLVDSETGRFVAIADSVKGRVSDITLLKESRALEKLPAGVAGMGDCACQGAEHFYPLAFHPHKKPRGRDLTEAEIAYNHAFSQRRIIVEMSINRLRRYASLTQMDRQHRRDHTARVCAVAGLVNRQFTHRMGA